MTATREERAAERRMDVGLAMVFGGEAAPDVARRVREEVAHRPHRAPWATAAVVLLGLGAVTAFWASGDDVGPRPRAIPAVPAQDPGHGPWVRTAAEIDRLPASTTALRCRLLDGNACRALARLTGLEELTLSGFCPEDEPLRAYVLPAGALDVVAGLPALRKLSLEVLAELDHTELAALLRLPRLTSLRLWRVEDLSDAHVDACRRLPALRELHLEGTGTVSDRGMKALSEMSGLLELRVRGVFDVTGAGYRQLAALRQLRVLDLGAPWYLWSSGGEVVVMDEEKMPVGVFDLDDEVLSAFGDMKQLEELALVGRRALTDSGLARLSALERLRDLDLTECNGITDAGLRHLPAGLRSLNISDCYRAGAAFPEHLRALQKLVANDVPLLGDASLRTIAELPELRYLEVDDAVGSTPACVASLAKASGLRHLSMRGLPWLNDEALGQLAHLRRLEHLAVGSFECRFRLAGTEKRAGGRNRITGTGVAELAALPSLRHLDLSATMPLRVASLRTLRALPLREIMLNWTDVIFDDETEGLEQLRQLWPGVEIKWWPPP